MLPRIPSSEGNQRGRRRRPSPVSTASVWQQGGGRATAKVPPPQQRLAIYGNSSTSEGGAWRRRRGCGGLLGLFLRSTTLLSASLAPPLQRPRLPRLPRLLPHRRLQPSHQQARVGRETAARQLPRPRLWTTAALRQGRQVSRPHVVRRRANASPPPAPPRYATSCCPERGGWQHHLLLCPGIPAT
jgi:hypothetical protein